MKHQCGHCGKALRFAPARKDGRCRDCSRKFRTCTECGKVRQCAIRQGPCMDCIKKQRARVKAEEAEAKFWKREASIDWGAVEWVTQGHRATKPLNAEERRLVVRRVSNRIVDDPNRLPPPGMVTVRTLAELLGCSGELVSRSRNELPPATRKRCPRCRGYMWVLEDGTIEQHGDGFLRRCKMSGEKHDAGESDCDGEVSGSRRGVEARAA